MYKAGLTMKRAAESTFEVPSRTAASKSTIRLSFALLADPTLPGSFARANSALAAWVDAWRPVKECDAVGAGGDPGCRHSDSSNHAVPGHARSSGKLLTPGKRRFWSCA